MIKKIEIYLALLLFMAACTDDYTVNISPAPDEAPSVTLSPEEKITFTAGEGSLDISVLTNMDKSSISVASTDTSWCKASLADNKVTVAVSENLKYIARSTYVTIKVFSVSRQVEVVQEAKQFVSEPIYPIDKTYRIQLPDPDSFESTKMYKVMDGEQKIAEICLEYLRNDQISSRAVVVYVGAGGAADYTNGFVAYLVGNDGAVSTAGTNGGVVMFNYDTNTFDYYEGTSGPVTTVYLSAYGVTKEEQEDAVNASPEPYLVSDRSGNSYPVVKIGCEVWLGSNLHTTKFGDGTAFDLISGSDMASYGKTIPFATYPMDNPALDISVYGYLYNSAVVKGNNEALIGSSIVDGNWRLATGGGTNSAGLNGTGTDWQRLFKYAGNNGLGALLAAGYSWSNGGDGAFDISTLSNLTGLSIVPAGEMYDVANYVFAIGADSQAFFFYGGGTAAGYNLAEMDGKAADQAGVRQWSHDSDACSIRLVRIDNR
ncbi:MAG: BACON domain-containing protein [Mangrovibacterium sp.]